MQYFKIYFCSFLLLLIGHSHILLESANLMDADILNTSVYNVSIDSDTNEDEFSEDADIADMENYFINLSFILFQPCDFSLDEASRNAIKNICMNYRYYRYDTVVITLADISTSIDRMSSIQSLLLSEGIELSKIQIDVREAVNGWTDDIVKLHLTQS